MPGRLKVWNAISSAWEYVSGATRDVPKYIPIDHFVTLNTGYSADTGVIHVPDIGVIPTDAVAVSLFVYGRHTVVTNANRVNVYDYNNPLRMRCQLTTGKVSGHYETISAHYVVLGGTNNRQFDFEVVIGAAGTTTVGIYITGYWTYNY